jgi:tetratricopeptide (TPR) repeat protein
LAASAIHQILTLIKEAKFQCVFILTGLTELMKSDSFSYFADAVNELLAKFPYLYISEDYPTSDLPCKFSRFISLRGFYYLPRCILSSLRQGPLINYPINEEAILDKLIDEALVRPWIFPVNQEAETMIHEDLDRFIDKNVYQANHLRRNVWLILFSQALNQHFDPNIFEPGQMALAVLLFNHVETALRYCGHYQLNRLVIFQLFIKCLDYHNQKDILQLDPIIQNLGDELIRLYIDQSQNWPLIANYYQKCVALANANRAPESRFTDLTACIRRFLNNTRLEDMAHHYEWVQALIHSLAIALMQADLIPEAYIVLIKLEHLSYVTNSTANQMRFYANLGTFLQELKRFPEAITCFLRVLDLHRKKLNDPNIGFIYNALGAVHLETNDLVHAIQYYNKSIEESTHYQRRNKHDRFSGWAHFSLAKISCRLGRKYIAIEDKDKFIDRIRLIFPENWPDSYTKCLHLLEEDIHRLDIQRHSLGETQSTSDQPDEESDEIIIISSRRRRIPQASATASISSPSLTGSFSLTLFKATAPTQTSPTSTPFVMKPPGSN